jgi:adenylyltransferase/sulfurtransferase
MVIPGWGDVGQQRLRDATVAVTGVGGLGCPVSIYLAAAGVGRLVLIDRDVFELSNLNRQILGWDDDIGKPKAEVARRKLAELNPEIEVEARVLTITPDNVAAQIWGCDVVVDAMDNWATRFTINDACVARRIPYVHAGIYGFNGQAMTVVPGEGPCLRCIIPVQPPEMTNFPVIGATPGLFAMVEVMETLKLIVGLGEPLVGRLLIFNGEDMSTYVVEVRRNPQCPVCSTVAVP